MVLADADIGHCAFALQIIDDSKLPRFGPGAIVIVDPEFPPHHRIIVIANKSNGEVICRQFLTDGKNISPSFYEIYDQALIADYYGLTQLVGVGLRKSLEFLIKDYCIKSHPEESQIIKNRTLSQLITRGRILNGHYLTTISNRLWANRLKINVTIFNKLI